MAKKFRLGNFPDAKVIIETKCLRCRGEGYLDGEPACSPDDLDMTGIRCSPCRGTGLFQLKVPFAELVAEIKRQL